MTIQPSDVPVFVLCGGLGTRIKEETEFRPKPMVPIGGYPILWHILRSYRSYGFRRFILCLGFKAEVIKDYFLKYTALRSDCTIDLKSNRVTPHTIHHDEDWEITLAYTGEESATGTRIAIAAEKYLHGASHFAVTYGDGLTDADLLQEFTFHLAENRTGTILGIHPPSRFGEICVTGSQVTKFDEKPEFKEKWINGGYFFFNAKFLSLLNKNENVMLEREPLKTLAERGELTLFPHEGFWACMDTQRDRDYLEGLWQSGRAPWYAK